VCRCRCCSQRNCGHRTRHCAQTRISCREIFGAGFGDDVGKAGGPFAEFRRHDTGAGLHFLDGIHVEVGKSSAAEFGIAGTGAISGEDSSDAALAVDGKLLGEVGGTVGVGHGAGGEEKKFAEVALVQREIRNLLAGEAQTAGGLGRSLARWGQQLQRLILRRKLEVGGELGTTGVSLQIVSLRTCASIHALHTVPLTKGVQGHGFAERRIAMSCRKSILWITGERH
jgi:hypothetical protein